MCLKVEEYHTIFVLRKIGRILIVLSGHPLENNILSGPTLWALYVAIMVTRNLELG